MILNKWWCFVACIPVMLSAGVTYTFAIWAESLKKTYQLDQTALQSVGAACNIGGFAGIFSGIVYDSLEKHPKLGPRLVLLIGACANSLGYLGLWAAATRRFDAQYWQLLVLAFIACNGGTWFDSSSLVTNVRNFPAHRGFVVGTLKSGIGLSASLYTAMYTGLLQSQGPPSYLLFLALFPSLAALLGSVFINHVPFVQNSEMEEGQHVFSTEGRFLFATQVIATLAVYLMTTALTGSMLPSSATLRVLATLGALLLLLPLLVVTRGSGGLQARPAHPLWREAEEGQVMPHQAVRRHLRTGHLVPIPDSPPADCSAAEEEQPSQGPAPSPPARTQQQPRRELPEAPAQRHQAKIPRGSGWPTAAAAPDKRGVGRAGELEDFGGAGAAGESVPLLSPLLSVSDSLEIDGRGSSLSVLSAASLNDARVGPEALPLTSIGGSSRRHRQHDDVGRGPLRKERREVGGAGGKEAALASAPDVAPLHCLCSLNFWLLFVACCIGMGAGLVLNNNLGELVRALGGPKGGQAVFVSLFGVMNCGGRLLMGYLPERMLHSSGVPRPVFLMATSFLTTAVSLLLAAARLPALYPLSLAAGFGFGAHWSLMPSLASELFGLHHFATNYTMLQLAPAVGSLALASRLAGWVYQTALERQGHTGNTCRGQQCFQLTFLVVTGLGLVATCCSTWLYFRTRDMYYCITFVAVHQHDHDVERHPFSLPEPQPNERQKQVKAQ